MLVVLLGVVLGCARDGPTTPTPAESLGTAVTGPRVVDSSRLFWASHDELVSSASASSATPFAILAISVASGQVRIVDSTMSALTALAPGGGAVYSNQLPIDGVSARYIPLGGDPARTFDTCTGLCVFLMAPAPDGDHVAIQAIHVSPGADLRRAALDPRARTLDSDSLRIYRLSTGTAATLEPGVPLCFSPASDELLASDDFIGSPLHGRVVTLATGLSAPVSLGVPDTMTSFHARWDVTGIRITYVASDARSLYDHAVTAGTTALLWASPDSISSFVASASGGWVAAWSSHLTGSGATLARRYALTAIHTTTHTVTEIAATTVAVSSAVAKPASSIFVFDPTGAIAFSPDERSVAYCFDERIYRSALPALGAARRR